MKVQVTAACTVNRSGPGNNPLISKPPNNTAAVGLPGIPSVSRGTSEGPTMALLADSAAITPSGSPWPNLLASGLNFRT